jgi:hypothetical protein
MAHTSELRERFGNGILQFTVVREQKHYCCFHAQIFALARGFTLRSNCELRRISCGRIFAATSALIPRASKS